MSRQQQVKSSFASKTAFDALAVSDNDDESVEDEQEIHDPDALAKCVLFYFFPDYTSANSLLARH